MGGLQVLDLLAALRTVGLDVENACRAVGLVPTSFGEGARVDIRRVAALFVEAERRLGDPVIGLHAGDRCEPRGLLTYLVMSSTRVEDGLHHAARFAGLLITGLRIEVAARGDRLSLTYEFDDRTIAVLPHLIDYLLLASLRGLQRAAPGELRPREAHLPHAEPGGRAEAARLFGCPVSFDRPRTQLVFSRRSLQTAARTANPLIAKQIERFAASLLAGITLPVTARDRVTRATRVLIVGGVRPDRATVARRLGMCDRTLQRALEVEGLTFREVRDGVLSDVIKAMLSNPVLTVAAVADGAGYGDVAAFSKAFRRWTGCTPTEYRARLGRRRSSHCGRMTRYGPGTTR